MKSTLLFLLISCALPGFAQDTVRMPFPPGRWCYDFTEDILSNSDLKLTAGGPAGKMMQDKCWRLSYINDYKNTLACWDSIMHPAYSFTTAYSLYFLKFKPVPAKNYILQRAKSERIIIINEAHQQPMHRVFTESLLAELYKEGYRYFGAEAISESDSLLNERKYPTLQTGGYIQQPQYGNLIRTALALGFYVFAYDTMAGIEQREAGEARNIKKILDKDPSAKIVIHCGFDHLAKTELPGFGKPMAMRLKDLTGIEPFCIDQTKFTESSGLSFDNPLYKTLNLNYYAVFVDSSGKLFNDPRGQNQYDVRVYHPRSVYMNGRPNWYFENGRAPFLFTEDIKVGYPCLLFAYPVNEDPTMAVPADVVELHSSDDKTALALAHGTYIIVARNRNKREQYFKIMF